MNVDTLMAAMNRQKLNVPVDVSGILLVYAKDNLVNALKTADAMRKMGNNVCMLTEEQAKDIDSCCEYAANSQIKDVVLLMRQQRKNSSSGWLRYWEESFHEIFNNSTGKRTSCKKCP